MIDDELNRGIIEKAGEYLEHFERKEREDGEPFIRLDDDAPDALQNLVQEAHSDFLPDDYRYEFVHSALITISEADEYGDLHDLEHSIEPDVYTSDLVNWLGSNSQRIGYVDEAREMFGADNFDSVVDAIRSGQELEKQEVFNSVLNTLRSR